MWRLGVGPARREPASAQKAAASGLLHLTHPRPQSTIGITKNKRSAAQQNLRALRHILQPLVCYCQNHTWKIVNNSPPTFVEDVVYFRKPRESFVRGFDAFCVCRVL